MSVMLGLVPSIQRNKVPKALYIEAAPHVVLDPRVKPEDDERGWPVG